MTIRTIGIDLGKTSVHIIGMDSEGTINLRKRLSRAQLIKATANLPVCLIAMEASCGAHHIGRMLAAQGHDVRLIPAQFVRPFVKSNKNDYIDAEAIAEAAQRPTMRFVPIKTEDQLDMQAYHRTRDRLVARRTGVINQLRAFLLERGIAVRQGRTALESYMPTLLQDADQLLSPRMHRLIRQLWNEWQTLESEIEHASKEIAAAVRDNEVCRRLLDVPGVGPLVASAMVAAIGNGSAFCKGREFAAWLGLTPRQHSTGGKAKLLGISKRGNEYLRRLFVHGARSVLQQAKRERIPMGAWLTQLEARVHRNVAVVALANKLARIAWAVLAKGEYQRITNFRPIT
jgi:transposase